MSKEREQRSSKSDNAKRAEAMHTANAMRIQGLMLQGINVDQRGLADLDLKMKLDSLYEVLVPQERKDADALKKEEIVDEQLSNVEKQVAEMQSEQRKQALLEGVIPMPTKRPRDTGA